MLMSIQNSSNSLDNLLSQIARQNITQRDSSARAAVAPLLYRRKQQMILKMVFAVSKNLPKEIKNSFVLKK